MASPADRTGSLPALVCAEPECDGHEEAPSSEIRPVEASDEARILRVFMCLRGLECQQAWLTVTDDGGTTFFEGWLSDDGVEVVVTTGRPDTRVRLLLESDRWHRQAHVSLDDGLTEHVFV